MDIIERKKYLEDQFYYEEDTDVTFKDLEDIAAELEELQMWPVVINKFFIPVFICYLVKFLC